MPSDILLTNKLDKQQFFNTNIIMLVFTNKMYIIYNIEKVPGLQVPGPYDVWISVCQVGLCWVTRVILLLHSKLESSNFLLVLLY